MRGSWSKSFGSNSQESVSTETEKDPQKISCKEEKVCVFGEMAEEGQTQSGGSSGNEEISGPIRGVLLISAGASHSVAVLGEFMFIFHA